MTTPDVSAIVVCFGHRATLATALSSLVKVGPRLRDVVVVDNAGGLESGPVERYAPAPSTVLVPGTNVGYAAGANLGVGATRGEILLFLSPDAVIVDWDTERVDASLEGTVGAVGAFTNDTLDRPSLSWGEFPGVSRVKRRVSGARKRFDQRVLETVASGGAATVPWVLGAAVLVLRSTFDRLGGYDPFYAAAGEDQDFGRRLQAHGLRSVVSSAWRVRHEPRGAQTLLPVIRKNELRFLRQYGSRFDRLLWTFLHSARNEND